MLTPLDFPKILSRQELDSLADMAIKSPLGENWIAISKLLTPEQKVEINRRIDTIKFNKGANKNLTNEGQGMNEETWNKIKEGNEASKFYGNMGQPETPEEYKARYGVWPPGYDKDGNKII